MSEHLFFLIWSNEHHGWWAPYERGYVQDWNDAGLYNLEDTLRIVKGANIHQPQIPNEAMVPFCGMKAPQIGSVKQFLLLSNQQI